MGGTATWTEKCPICKGEGKLVPYDSKTKTVSLPINCIVCDGHGAIMVRKSMKRRKK